VDADEMENLRNKIKELYSSTELSEKQQKSLLENGSVKLFKHWDTIFKESGFGNGIFNRIYYILSVYSHSEGLSIIQMKSAKYLLDKKENSSMVFMQLFCSTLMTAVMIKNICSKHKSCNGRFKEIDPKEQHTVNFFTKLAKKAIA